MNQPSGPPPTAGNAPATTPCPARPAGPRLQLPALLQGTQLPLRLARRPRRPGAQRRAAVRGAGAQWLGRHGQQAAHPSRLAAAPAVLPRAALTPAPPWRYGSLVPAADQRRRHHCDHHARHPGHHFQAPQPQQLRDPRHVSARATPAAVVGCKRHQPRVGVGGARHARQQAARSGTQLKAAAGRQ